MANKTFDLLTALSTPATGDLVAIADVDASNEAKKTTVGELSAAVGSAINAVTGDGSINEVVQLTQAEYEALTPQSDTIYVITGGDVTVTANVQGAASNTVNRIVTIDQAAYDTLVADPAGPDANTLYVIEDGVTKDSYNGQIDTVAASKTYYLDAAAVTDRTITSIFMNGTLTGAAGTMALEVDGTTEATIDFTNPLPQTPAITASVSATNSIALVTDASVTGVTDLFFVVEYEV